MRNLIIIVLAICIVSCTAEREFGYDTFSDLKTKHEGTLREYIEQTTSEFVENVIPTKYEYQDSFFNQILVNALAQDLSYGIPLEIMTAQAILESGWGRSKLSSKYNNYFGIKEYRKDRSSAYMVTNEVVNGKKITKKAKFRKYEDPSHCFADRVIWFHQNERYAGKDFRSMNYIEFANMLQEKGYATDPNYSKKLIRIIEKYKLEEYSKFMDRILEI